MKKTILITGVSSGFGRAIADAALEAGHRVVGTARTEQTRDRFAALKPGRSFCLLLDVADTPSISPRIAEAEHLAGPIDVLINNAGYGHEGIVEESSIEDLRHQFEVNVFGAVAVIQAVLPGMRAHRRGHIVNITSMGAVVTFPGLAYYHGSKFALEGISDALAKEVAPLGIRVTTIQPGSLRTDWAGRSLTRSPRQIHDYDDIFDPVRKRRLEGSGAQLGDPAKAASAILHLIDTPRPPSRLVLGQDAHSLIKEKMASISAEMDEWECLCHI